MEKLIREIIDSGLLRYEIDMQLRKDSVYTKDVRDAEQLHAYIEKNISEEQRMVLDDYEAVVRSANARAQELSYVLCVRNTIAYLQQTNALKIV